MLAKQFDTFLSTEELLPFCCSSAHHADMGWMSLNPTTVLVLLSTVLLISICRLVISQYQRDVPAFATLTNITRSIWGFLALKNSGTCCKGPQEWGSWIFLLEWADHWVFRNAFVVTKNKVTCFIPQVNAEKFISQNESKKKKNLKQPEQLLAFYF